MEKVRVASGPRQDDSRIVVLGAVLWPDSIALHATVESDAEEIASEFQEGDQATMFAITDGLGNSYEGGGGGASDAADVHVTDWDITFHPGVPDDATSLRVTIWVRHSVWAVSI